MKVKPAICKPSVAATKKYGFKKEIVQKMNTDKPCGEILHANFPSKNIKHQMKEKHPGVHHFEIPIIFKNGFHQTCLEEDYYAECKDEIMEFITTTYGIQDEEGDLNDIFDPAMMEPYDSFDIDSDKPCVDLRSWVYTTEEEPKTIPLEK